MAALKVIKERAKDAQKLDDYAANELHRQLVEQSIYGLDINKHAVQLAACNLTIGAPNTDYRQINLHSLPHGPAGDGAEVKHGALELLLEDSTQAVFKQTEIAETIAEPPPVYGKDVMGQRQEVTAALPEFGEADAVIFNPPFTDVRRANKRYSKQTLDAMRARLLHIKDELVKQDPAAKEVIGKQSVRPFFTPLAHQLIHPTAGTLAEIMPANTCTSAKGRIRRQYLAANYHIDMVITSHDPKEYAFSANTAIYECLLIGRRRPPDENTPEHYHKTPELHADTAKPSAVTPEPSADTPDPSGVARESSGFTPESSGLTPKFSGVRPQPSGVTPEFNDKTREYIGAESRVSADSPPTRFIQLTRFPADTAAVDKLIAAINSNRDSRLQHAGIGTEYAAGIEAGDAGIAPELFTVTEWPAEKVTKGDWTPVQWCNPELAYAAADMDTLPNCIAAGDVYKLARVDKKPAVFVYELDKNDGNMFCEMDADIMQTISAKPETKATVKPGKETQAEKVWAKADYALIANEFSTTSSRLVAVYSEQTAVGTEFRPVGVGDKDVAKAYVAFMNSSFGILQMLNRRTRKLSFPNFEGGHLKTLRLPDPAAADLQPLLDAFDAVKHTPLQRLAAANKDEARRLLDYAAAKSLGVDPKITDRWRDLLAREPTITGKPYKN